MLSDTHKIPFFQHIYFSMVAYDVRRQQERENVSSNKN